MSYSLAIIKRVFIVKWIAPEPADVAAVLNQLARAHEAAATPMIYVAIVSKDSKPPSDAAKRALGEGMKKAFEFCESIHLVMEGTGFTQTVNRSILGAIFLIGGKRGRVFVTSTVEEALTASPAHCRAELALALGAARGRGFFSEAA